MTFSQRFFLRFIWLEQELLSLFSFYTKPHTSAEPWPPDKPLISVVIPCYNHGAYLSEAVDSVLSQTWQNFEIIVVDDGSDEPETRSILKNFSRPKTRIIHHKRNKGLPAARNTGIREAIGKYICCLDADDKLHPTYLEKALLMLESNHGIGFVYPWTQVFGSENRVWYAPQFDPSALIYYNQLNPPAVFRRSAWESVGGFREEMRLGYEDWEFWIRVAYHGYRGYRIPEKLLFYRRGIDKSFAQSAAEKHDLLFSLIRRYNVEIYNNTNWLLKVKQHYKNIYVVNPLLNISNRYYYKHLTSVILFIHLHSLKELKYSLSSLQRKDTTNVIIASFKLLDENTMDMLHTYTPYIYILPHFLPRYMWTKFISLLTQNQNINQIIWT